MGDFEPVTKIIELDLPAAERDLVLGIIAAGALNILK
jgi:hypothetical protein